MMGARVIEMTEEEVNEVVNWFQCLKVQIGDYCRDKVNNEIIANCTRLQIHWDSIADIQLAWAGVKNEEE